MSNQLKIKILQITTFILGLYAITSFFGIGKLHYRILRAEEEVVHLQKQLTKQSTKITTTTASLETHEERRSTEEAILRLNPYSRYLDTVSIASAINKYSEEYGIDPKTVVAIAYHESRFNKYAISPAGAVGVMQVMPFWVDQIDFLEEYRDLYDVDKNIRAGLYIYSRYLDEFNGNEVLALLAYNRGPNRVKYELQRGRNPANGYSVAVLKNRNKLNDG